MANDLPRTVSELLRHIDEGYTAFTVYVRSMSETTLTGPTDPAGWTIKDHIAHIVVWEDGMNAVLTHQYHERYGLPVMHTETNIRDDNPGDAERWLWKQWANVLRVRNDGVPVMGFTWYSLTDQVDWNTALREPNGHVDKVGLYDLDRRIRPVGRAYQRLVSQWREVLPTQSLCLQVPVVMPSAFDPECLPEAYWAMQARRRGQ